MHQQVQLDVSAALYVRQRFHTVADIEDWPGSSNLDHNYLFFWDVTCDKMPGCGQDNRVGQSGNQGIKNGRFRSVREGRSIRRTTISCEARGHSLSSIGDDKVVAHADLGGLPLR